MENALFKFELTLYCSPRLVRNWFWIIFLCIYIVSGKTIEEQQLQQPENLSNTSEKSFPSKENQNNPNLTIDSSKLNTHHFPIMHPAFQIKSKSEDNSSSIADRDEVKTYTELQNKLYKENHSAHFNSVNLISLNSFNNRLNNEIDSKSNFSDSDCCNSSDSEEIDLTSGMSSTVDFTNNNKQQ